jgi:glycosyltransferase involved in cell wall biosynthesis
MISTYLKKHTTTKDISKAHNQVPSSILFTAPRYHTNQIPIVKGLKEQNITVSYLVQYKGIIEDHALLEPMQFKESFVSKLINRLRQSHRNTSDFDFIETKFFIPSLLSTFQQIHSVHPDVVIMRNRSKISMVVTFVCRLQGIKKLVLYNQSPLCTAIKLGFKKKLLYLFFPKVRMTPVKELRFYKEKYPNRKQWTHNYFIPLIFPVPKSSKTRHYLIDGIIHIVCIGKYRDYKNHRLLVQAVEMLSEKERKKIKVTIIGQNTIPVEHEYLKQLKLLIAKKGVQSIFNLQCNRPYNLMQEVYLYNDVLVLPSKLETAGMVILEAMAYGLCTISSDNCGLASYIIDANGGFNFDYQNATSLARILQTIIQEPALIPQYGKNAQKYVKEKLSFPNYYNKLNDLLKKEYSYSLEH